MKGKSVHSQMFPSLQEISGKKKKKNVVEKNAPKAAERGEHRLQNAPPRPARPRCPSSAEGEGALCSSGVMPGGSCAPLTCSSSDTSNILVDIQLEVNAASSSSNSHKAFSEVFAASTGSITAEKKEVPELTADRLVLTRVFWGKCS